MKRLTLRDLPAGCFDGVIPAVLGTCSDDGTPNATWLSHVFLLDDRHVALSCQFFRKTRANLAMNPQAQLLVVAPYSIKQWRLNIRFLRSETQGRTFELMQSRIEAIASVTRMESVFALKTADVFEVDTITPIETEESEEGAPSVRGTDRLLELSRLTEVIGSSADLRTLVDSGLGFLATQLGYESVGIYLLEESEQALYALATHGFATSGVGARVELGVGVIGTCARHRVPIRIADASRERLYGRAVQEQIERGKSGAERDIPLASVAGARSLLAVPLLLQGRLFGVLATECQHALAFSERDAQLLTTAGQLLAQGIALYREEEVEQELDREPPSIQQSASLQVRYYEADDSVFIDGEYLIRGLPGKILWLLLSLRQKEGRTTFQNRELRLHPFLKMPAINDNLATRLLMLQRRLDDKRLPIQLHREERGRLRLACDLNITLESVSA
ncbi:MAG TPA: GAF domain-containing protein [Polyangiaceae bacterium]|nr:GAF domain-containing protein [Polyangiaceae bacterium]